MKRLNSLLICCLLALSNNTTHAFSLKQKVKKIGNTIKEHPYITTAIILGTTTALLALKAYRLNRQEEALARSCIKDYDKLMTHLKSKAAALNRQSRWEYHFGYNSKIVYSIDYYKFYNTFCNSPECAKKLEAIAGSRMLHECCALTCGLATLFVPVFALDYFKEKRRKDLEEELRKQNDALAAQ